MPEGIEENKEINVMEDENKKIIDDLNARHDIEMQAANAKYTALLRAYANGERGDSSESKEPTQEELKAKYESNIKLVHKNEAKAIDQAKALLDVRDYRMNVLHERDIFLPSNGTPSSEDETNAQHVAEAMQQSIDVANGDDAVYRAAMASRLVDSVYKR